MYNIFSTKKNKPYTSSSTSYVNPFDYYSSVKNAVGNRSVAPKQQSQVQSQSPLMSVERPKIQGSGFGSQYASNPTNYQRPQQDNTFKLPQDTVQPPTFGSRQKSLIDQSLLSGQQYGQAQLNSAQQKQKDLEDFYNKQNEIRMSQLLGSKDSAKSAADRFVQSTRQGITNVEGTAQRNKENAEVASGEAIRRAAQARNETSAQTGRKFAGLNATDSYGEGSYQRAQENIDSDFNRYVAENSRQLSNQKAEIDNQLLEYTSQAELAIQNKEAELSDLLAQIDATMQQGSAEHQYAVAQIQREYQDTVSEVQNWLASIENESQQQKLVLDQEMASLTSFSPEFMTTGVPTNQQEYEYLIKNADAFDKVYGFDTGKGANETNDITNLVSELLSSNTDAVTGLKSIGNYIPGSSEQLTKNKIDQLQALLSLGNIEKLKGTGAISDRESALLSQAASALGTNLSNQDFKYVLTQIQNALGGQSRPSLEQFDQ